MRRTMIIVPLALTAALLTGCTSGAYTMSDSGARGPLAGPDYSIESNPEAFAPSADKALSVVGPQIITTVDVTVTVAAPLTAADDASKIADKFGGNVSYRSESSATDDYPGSAHLTLRIPSSKLTQALEELKALGTARETSINAMDVSTESKDLAARIASLQTSVDRLLTLMSQATSTENLLAVETVLSQRQSDLESLQAQKRNLDDQVQLSTVNLYLESKASAPAPNPNNFWTGLVSGWNAFVGFWSAALVVLGVLVPWLAAAGLIALIVIVWVKRTRPRREAKRAARSAMAPAFAAPAPTYAPAPVQAPAPTSQSTHASAPQPTHAPAPAPAPTSAPAPAKSTKSAPTKPAPKKSDKA